MATSAPAIPDIGQAVEDLSARVAAEINGGADSADSASAEAAAAAASAAAGPPAVDEIESLCMRCHEQGTTRLLLTRVPHFRELVIMAFECPHCNESNNEVQFAGSLQPAGVRFSLSVPVSAEGAAEETIDSHEALMNRQVVKSDSATIRIPEIDFEIPPESQRGTLTTVEGVLTRAHDGLGALQAERRAADAAVAAAIDEFLAKLKSCIDGSRAFTLVLDDPSGNSYVENPRAPEPDPILKVEHYERTAEQNEKLGFLAAPAGAGEDGEAGEGSGGGAAGDPTKLPHGSVGAELAYRAIAGGNNADLASNALLCGYSAPEEVMVFPATCSACGASGPASGAEGSAKSGAASDPASGGSSGATGDGGEEDGEKVDAEGKAEGGAEGGAEGEAAHVDEVCVTRMFATRIPYFKDVILMATSCDACGYKNSELKAAGGVAPKGRKITLTVRNQKDLSRDIIKAESAAVYIPEIELELGAGTLGGRVTTVEGLVTEIADSLKRIRPFEIGDSAPEWQRSKWQDLDKQLRALAAGEPVSVKRNRAGAGASGAGNENESGAKRKSENEKGESGEGGGVEEAEGEEMEELTEWHLVLDDALANSFVSFVGERLEDDGQVQVEEYVRSWEQDEELGLHDMRTGEEHGQGKAELEAIQDRLEGKKVKVQVEEYVRWWEEQDEELGLHDMRVGEEHVQEEKVTEEKSDLESIQE
ncbi:unnamed protein product [Closterium sp. NIES-64]|nr:unnamed protein product [Closterium sp. NIES-65]CAI5942865.1 unnamed protein product [Closterium sp. NIES-65]CAI5980803.1 unnamed protein product [Closterium sp. NIES-64]CAI5991681.1 unnamed protein product [Closterium sp. NIES-64]